MSNDTLYEVFKCYNKKKDRQLNSEKFNNETYTEEKKWCRKPKSQKAKMEKNEKNLKAQMQKYFVNPETVDNKNPQQ